MSTFKNDIKQIQLSTKEESEWIDNQIDKFNIKQLSFAGQHPQIQKNYIIKDNNKIIAGINTTFYLDSILHVGVLFVDAEYRNQGLGTALMLEIEKKAKTMGTKLIHLDSFDFQAKDFYIKLGYEIFGILEDCPLGHKRYYLKKKL